MKIKENLIFVENTQNLTIPNSRVGEKVSQHTAFQERRNKAAGDPFRFPEGINMTPYPFLAFREKAPLRFPHFPNLPTSPLSFLRICLSLKMKIFNLGLI